MSTVRVLDTNLQARYLSQDILVNSIGSTSLNRSYRDLNQPIHVEPAAKLFLSIEAIRILFDLRN